MWKHTGIYCVLFRAKTLIIYFVISTFDYCMKLSFIGSGNSATVLAHLCREKGHTLQQIIARNEEAGRALAAEMNCSYIPFGAAPDRETEAVIICLSDNALSEALCGMNFGNIPVMHTAGAVSMNVLQTVSSNYGILYPLQSLSRKNPVIPSIPFIVEGNNEHMRAFVRFLAGTLSDTVDELDEERRLRLHAAAVIVNNFTNYLYSTAKDFCDKEKIDFDLLKPLIVETAERIKDNSPADVQTGPAIRKDIITLDKHLRLLSNYPKLRTMYMRMTDGIMNP